MEDYLLCDDYRVTMPIWTLSDAVTSDFDESPPRVEKVRSRNLRPIMDFLNELAKVNQAMS